MLQSKHLAALGSALLLGVVFATAAAAQVSTRSVGDGERPRSTVVGGADAASQVGQFTTRLDRPGRTTAVGPRLDLQVIEIEYANGRPIQAIIQASLAMGLAGVKLSGRMTLTQGAATIGEAVFQNLSEARLEASVDLQGASDLCLNVDATATYGDITQKIKRSLCLETSDVVIAG
jgi:hypothetical protein